MTSRNREAETAGAVASEPSELRTTPSSEAALSCCSNTCAATIVISGVSTAKALSMRGIEDGGDGGGMGEEPTDIQHAVASTIAPTATRPARKAPGEGTGRLRGDPKGTPATAKVSSDWRRGEAAIGLALEPSRLSCASAGVRPEW